MANHQTRVNDSSTGDISESDHNIFFAAVETTRMPMIVTDPKRPDNPIIFANNAFIDMTGYSREEIVGANCRFLQGPETDPKAVREVREAIQARTEVAVELVNYKKRRIKLLERAVYFPCVQRLRRLDLLFCLPTRR